MWVSEFTTDSLISIVCLKKNGKMTSSSVPLTVLFSGEQIF